VARKQQTASRKGADLDGVVDFWFSAATLWWLWVLRPEIYTTYAAAILVGVAAFRSVYDY
jgi:phosphatidylglycerophosphate synthase